MPGQCGTHGGDVRGICVPRNFSRYSGVQLWAEYETMEDGVSRIFLQSFSGYLFPIRQRPDRTSSLEFSWTLCISSMTQPSHSERRQAHVVRNLLVATARANCTFTERLVTGIRILVLSRCQHLLSHCDWCWSPSPCEQCKWVFWRKLQRDSDLY